MSQTTLTAITNTMPKGSRKRTLTMANGDELDLKKGGLEASGEVVEALRLRILELEDQLWVSQSLQQPPAKKARISDASSLTAVSAPSATSTSKKATADAKKTKLQVKKIYDSLKKEVKNGVKWQGSSKTIKVDEVMEKEEFDAIFKGKGVLIQPTPSNKPTSTVTIMHFNSATQLTDLFGELGKLTGTRWTRGGLQRGYGFFGGGGGMVKSEKIGPCEVKIRALEVNYAKNTLKCTLKFDCYEIGAGCFEDSDDY